MDDRRRREAESLFEGALDVELAKRGEWLIGVTGDDIELRAQVEALLEAHGRAEGVLERADPLRLATSLIGASSVRSGATLGRYRIVREIGRGGMSTVYLGERADGQFERKVAVKIVRGGPYAEDLTRRLRTERQILASLDHAEIARLLDGDVTEDGSPYLVMEHVEGLPIDVYCDQRRLTIPERLHLFCRVVRAVHHAHRNLVVHRDLKPSNVLVTASGQPKLLDFGIARILGATPVGAPLPVTRPGILPMTPEYASPEQLRGETLTTASDVYSLGVMLYELLCGYRPHGRAEGSPREIVEAICGREPELPSRRARAQGGFVCLQDGRSEAVPAAVASVRRSVPERLERQLSGDLDAIALKALRKEAEERYASAEDLARDIERHLHGLPIDAHRGGRLYRARKFIRHYRAYTAAAAVAFLSLIAGSGAVAWQATEARRERDRAQAARLEADAALVRAREVAAALTEMLAAGDPRAPGSRDTATARALITLGLARVEVLQGQPDVQAGLLDVLARVSASLDELAQARALAGRSLAIRRRQFGDNHPELAASFNTLAEVAYRQGPYQEAEALHRQALDLQVRHLGPSHLEVAGTLTELARHIRGRLAEVEELHERAFEIRRASLGSEHPLVANSLMHLGRIRRARGKPEQAETAYRDALEIRRAALGPDHPDGAETLVYLADLAWMDHGDTARAEALYRRALAIQGGAPNHPYRMHALGNLADLLSHRGDHAAAERLLRESLEVRRTAFGSRHRAVAEGLDALASEFQRQGRLREAERQRRDALLIWKDVLGPDHWALSGALVNLATVLVDQGRYDEAERLYGEGLDIRRKATGENSAGVAAIVGELGRLHARRGDYARAESLYLQALQHVLGETTDQHRDARRLHRELADVYTAWGRHDKARNFRLLADKAGPG